MPGIVGIFSPEGVSAELGKSFSRMCESLRHLPNQTVSSHTYANLLLGRVDLGIFQANMHPREDNDVLAFIWGELLNPQVERRELLNDYVRVDENISDLDFATELFRKHDSDFASYLRGSFSVFILDKRHRKLILASDRFGLRPLYYYSSGKEFVFSSEVNAILRYPGLNKRVNTAGLADFFCFGFVTGNKTFIRDVEMLPPSMVLSVGCGGIKTKAYWRLVFSENLDTSREDDYVDGLADVIRTSVKANMTGDFRFGLPLSGGLDSRTIAACLRKDTYPVLAYTWGMPNSEEVRIARRVANKLGLSHHNLHRTPEELVENFAKSVIMTDGMIPGNLPLGNFLYERAFARQVDICLDGMQSICMVSPLRRALTDDMIFEALPAPGLQSVLIAPSYSKFQALSAASKDAVCACTPGINPVNRFQYLDIMHKQRRLDSFGLLVKRNFVEVRSPLFDYRVIDFIQQTPPALRRQRYLYYKAFCRISPELAAIKTTGTMVPVTYPYWLQLAGRIKQGIRTRLYATCDKIGLPFDRHSISDWGIDYNFWYKESKATKQFIREVLAPSSTKHCDHLDPAGIQELLNTHFRGGRNYADIINRLLTYVIWTQMWRN